ncbi:MAG: aldehyde dehydrogenase family protein, partial [Sphingobium sp.]|nr:aldehyde dehydrogenase family protein [Sphingobium sp.]
MTTALTSHEPATGVLLWQGEAGDVDAEVARARGAWPRWAAQPIAVRIETLRRFVNGVRRNEDALADLIARETGKPLWDAHAEVTAVMAKVDISVAAYSERTGQKRLEAALAARQSVRHKPHG